MKYKVFQTSRAKNLPTFGSGRQWSVMIGKYGACLSKWDDGRWSLWFARYKYLGHRYFPIFGVPKGTKLS